MESQEQSPGDVVTAGEDSHPITQAIDTVEVMHAGATAPAANTMDPPTIPLAPMKRMQARFNPLADGLMYVVVFVGGFVGVGCRHALDMLLPSVSGTPFVVGTFVSNMVACFLFAMLTEFMATASWLRRRVRQVVSRGVGLGLLGGLSTMSGVMLETMEGLHERHIASALGYLAGNFAGGLLTAAAGVVLMQALLSRSTRKRVRGAFSAVSVSDSAESDTQGVRHVKVADVARSAAQAAMEAAQTAQQIAQTGQVPRVETPTVPPTAIQPMQTGHVPQIPPLVVPQLTQSSQPLLREPDTSEFITALQLDTKLDGIPADILAAALQQAKEARATILEVINECIDGPAEMSEFAPRIITTSVPVEKIGEVKDLLKEDVAVLAMGIYLAMSQKDMLNYWNRIFVHNAQDSTAPGMPVAATHAAPSTISSSNVCRGFLVCKTCCIRSRKPTSHPCWSLLRLAA
ncbi:chromosome condensation protein CrcB, partial [Bifidobacterium longum]